jgi:hypothetical protein
MKDRHVRGVGLGIGMADEFATTAGRGFHGIMVTGFGGIIPQRPHISGPVHVAMGRKGT